MSNTKIQHEGEEKSRSGLVAGSVPDVRSIMQTIRERVKAEVAQKGSAHGAPRQTQIFQAGNSTCALGSSEELRFLNQQVHFSAKPSPETISSHRAGLLGKLIVNAKKKLQRMLWETLLADYFQRERDFHTNLVRLLNQVCRELDQKARADDSSELRDALEELQKIARDGQSHFGQSQSRVSR